MLLYQRFVPGLAIASYVVGDERTGEAAVVDPTRDVDDFIRYATENDLHIKHVLETHGGKLQERFADVPRDKPVAVICGSGYRASIAASFLKREGYEDVANILGGMSAWKGAELPTVTD